MIETQEAVKDLMGHVDVTLATLGQGLNDAQTEGRTEDFTLNLSLISQLGTIRGEIGDMVGSLKPAAVDVAEDLAAASPASNQSDEEWESMQLRSVELNKDESEAPSNAAAPAANPAGKSKKSEAKPEPKKRGRKPKVKEVPSQTDAHQEIEEVLKTPRYGLEPGTYTTVKGYREPLMEAFAQFDEPVKLITIQQRMLENMQKSGRIKELDLVSAGQTKLPRYVAQSASLRRELINKGLVQGNANSGFSLTEKGRKEWESEHKSSKSRGEKIAA